MTTPRDGAGGVKRRATARARVAAAEKVRQPVPPREPVDAAAEAARGAQLLTMEEAAAYLRYTGSKDPANSAYAFLRARDVRLLGRGNRRLVRVGDIDRVLETGSSDLVDRALALVPSARR